MTLGVEKLTRNHKINRTLTLKVPMDKQKSIFSLPYAESFFKAWNIQIRNAWQVSPMTHTFLVEDYFASGYVSLRNQIYSRYVKFIQKLSLSPSKKIRFLHRILVSDPRSNIKKNVWFLSNLTSVDICRSSTFEVKQLLPVCVTPDDEK